jgi:sporulation protein YlmC with PRC-barrel domain
MPAAHVPASGDGFREARIEDLIGHTIRDVAGRKIGRIEEVVAEQRGTELVVVEVHAGPGALLERLLDLATLIPYSGALQRRFRRLQRIPWHQLDWTDPERPRATVHAEELDD